MDEMLACGAKMVVAIVDACRNQYRIDYQSLAEQVYISGVQDGLEMNQELSENAANSPKEFKFRNKFERICYISQYIGNWIWWYD